jgi:hypothetical protein
MMVDHIRFEISEDDLQVVSITHPDDEPNSYQVFPDGGFGWGGGEEGGKWYYRIMCQPSYRIILQ